MWVGFPPISLDYLEIALKSSTMRKATLLATIKKCKLDIPGAEKGSTAWLRQRVAELIPTYIEDHFARRIRNQLLPRNPTFRFPMREAQVRDTAMRYDFCWVSRRVTVEIHGGLKNARSGHRTEEGVKRDMLKANMAQADGFFHIQLTTEDVMDDAIWEKVTLPLLELALRRLRSNVLL